MRAFVVLLEVAGASAQFFLMWQLIDHQKHMGCGERCAWEAMGLMAMLAVSMWVVIPGTLGALYNAAISVARWRDIGDNITAVVFHAAVALLPILLMVVLIETDKPLPGAEEARKKAEALTPMGRYLSGIEWAQKNGVISPGDCKTAPANDSEFLRGCTRIAENQQYLLRSAPNPGASGK
jgi:hypothetical protein